VSLISIFRSHKSWIDRVTREGFRWKKFGIPTNELTSFQFCASKGVRSGRHASVKVGPACHSLLPQRLPRLFASRVGSADGADTRGYFFCPVAKWNAAFHLSCSCKRRVSRGREKKKEKLWYALGRSKSNGKNFFKRWVFILLYRWMPSLSTPIFFFCWQFISFINMQCFA